MNPSDEYKTQKRVKRRRDRYALYGPTEAKRTCGKVLYAVRLINRHIEQKKNVAERIWKAKTLIMLKQLLRVTTALIAMVSFCWTMSAQDCTTPLEFTPALTPATSVECLDDLPTACDDTQGASRGEVSCGIAADVQSRTLCTATTAMGSGEDGAIVLFDVDGDPNDDRYFIPTDAGMTLTQFENGVAVVSGQVADVDDATAILNVNIYYDQGTSGADWNGGFKTAMECTPTTDITDDWTIYVLNSGLSFLTGEGSLDGTTLQLTHAPSSEYFGFQVGEMANDRNCNEGAGGWFSYNGTLAGAEIQGGTGDVLLDLDCQEEENNECGDDESTVTLFYAAYDEDCGDVLLGTETYTRQDTQDPTFDNAPADVTVACADMDIPVPTVTASDNCEDSDAVAPSVTYLGQSPQYDIECTGTYKVDRIWEAMDCSGNTAGHTQTITVIDDIAPVIAGGADYTAECDGAGNLSELNTWLEDNGGATATDNCGPVSWSHNFEGLSDGCGATGTADVTFTASDDCGNSSTTTLTFTIEDTTDPDLTVAPTHDIACEDYDPAAIYAASASDLCGSASVVLVSSNQVSGSCAGSYLHVYKAIDECGNESATMDQVVNLIDETAPTFTLNCPADQDLFTDDNCYADTSVGANGSATFSDLADNCDAAPTTAISHEDVTTPGCTGSYSIARTWTITATDHCGNATTHTCVQTITVTDNIAPVPSISCPADYTVDADENCAADTTPDAAGSATASATDNCSPEANIALDITYSDGAATYACEGSTASSGPGPSRPPTIVETLPAPAARRPSPSRTTRPRPGTSTTRTSTLRVRISSTPPTRRWFRSAPATTAAPR